MRKDFRLPDLGEGLTEGEIVRWLVGPGDTVTLNQVVVEVETAKAAVELPSPYAGVVAALHHKEGDTVDVDTPLLTIDTSPGLQATQAADDPVSESEADPGSLLVGYGPKSGGSTRRARRSPAASFAAPPAGQTESGAEARPLAAPPVRKLARDLGIDLASLASGSGPDGLITREDVEQAATGTADQPPVAAPAGAGQRRIAVTGVRRHIAANMVASAFSAPHVTVFLTVDVTPTMLLRERLANSAEFAGVKLSPLVFAAKAVVLAVRRHPMINSSWDEAAQEIVVKDYVNLGIAAATPRGLVVPNIKNAERLSLPDLARALDQLSETARSGKSTPADLASGTITITNIGVFGVDTGTPILHPGESAILALGAVRPTPWVHEGEVRVRQVTQLALSFDHRVVDGALGSAFLADVGAVLADPATALLWS